MSAAPAPLARKTSPARRASSTLATATPVSARRLALVRRDVVAQRKDLVVDRLGRRGIEDRGHAGHARDLEPALRRGDRLLELGDEDGRVADHVGRRLDIRRR